MLRNCPNLHTLRMEIMVGRLWLPCNPELYVNLENLAIRTNAPITERFVSAITLEGKNHRLKKLGLIVRGFFKLDHDVSTSSPGDSVINLLNGIPSLNVCVIYSKCRLSYELRQDYTRSIKDAKKLARKMKLDFEFIVKSSSYFFDFLCFADSDLCTLDK